MMMNRVTRLMLAMVTAGFLMFPAVTFAQAKNPCAANPCAAKKNPCAPSTDKKAEKGTKDKAAKSKEGAANPCAAKNPCAGKNPCAAKK
jgi:hypothetical protein